MTEAAFYSLEGPLSPALLEKFSALPGVELTLTPQLELHEHLVGFLGYVSAIAGAEGDPKVTRLMEYILSAGECLEFKFDSTGEGTASQMKVREELHPLNGIWLIADGVFDREGLMILGADGGIGSALAPEVPEPRRSYAEFLYGALERERDQEDLGEDVSLAHLTARPLDECYRLIEAGCRKAQGYGFKNTEDQFAFVSVMLEIGPNFDDHPEIKRILSDASIPVEKRLDACVDHPEGERIWNEVAALINPEAWSEFIAH